MNRFDHQQIDDIIHSRIRLAIMAALNAAERLEFSYLRDQVNTTDGNLGAHLAKLEEAKYIAVQKVFEDRKPVSYYRVTPKGRNAFRAYLKHLGSLIK